MKMVIPGKATCINISEYTKKLLSQSSAFQLTQNSLDTFQNPIAWKGQDCPCYAHT